MVEVDSLGGALGKWLRVLVAGAVAAIGCGGSDGKDCERYAQVTCEKACACSADPACTIVWGASLYQVESRAECERTLGDICRSETRFDPESCVDMVESTACSGATYVHPLCPLGGADGGLDPNRPAILEVIAPERTSLTTVAIRGRTANATRVVIELAGGDASRVLPVSPGSDFCDEMPLPAGAVATYVLHAIGDDGNVSAPASVEVEQDAEAPEPAEPSCSGGECAAEEECSNQLDDDCNALADECDPACNGCADDELEPNDVPFSVPRIEDGTYALEICPCRDDWFAFDMSAGATVTATASFTNVEIDIDLALYRAADAEVGLDNALVSSMSTTDAESISFEADATGSYYLRVYSIRRDGRGSYSLTVGTSP